MVSFQMETEIAKLDEGKLRPRQRSRNLTNGPTRWNESQQAISGLPKPQPTPRETLTSTEPLTTVPFEGKEDTSWS
jgi:hypothetical protein